MQLDNKTLLQYFRVEKDIMDIQDIVDGYDNLEYDTFTYSIEDIDSALNQIDTLDEQSFFYWYYFFKGFIQDDNTLYYRYTSINQLLDIVLDILHTKGENALDDARREVELYKCNTTDWSLYRLKRLMIQFYDMDVNVDRLDENGVIAYKAMIDAFIEDQCMAMELLAYSYYGGDQAYPCDFYKAKELLEKLMVYNPNYKEKYANTLGYIYYYGRCNKGIPEYEKAYAYFLIGEQAGYYESTYKLADMYRNGYYVQKDERLAYLMINKLFDRNFDQFRKGQPSNLADVALRLASMTYDGQGCVQDHKEAFWLYLVAYESIKTRDYYGDSKVIKSIEEGLRKCKKHFDIPNEQIDHVDNLPQGLLSAFHSNHIVKVVVDKEEDGCKITTSLVPFRNGENEKIIVLDLMQGYLRFKDEVYDYCDSHPIETMNQFVAKQYNMQLDKEEDSITFYADQYEIHEDMIFFLLFDKEVMSFKGGTYIYYLNEGSNMN